MKQRIDEKLVRLCAVLNDIPEVRTTASCEGHPEENMFPYVAFIAPVEFAAVLERELREAKRAPSPLRTDWMMEGTFNDRYELVFRLYPPRFRNYRRSDQKRILETDWPVVEAIVDRLHEMYV